MKLHEFWFGSKIAESPEYLRERLPFWFVANFETDEQIRARFQNLKPHLHPATARESLETILILDQLPRNLFRNSSRAYAHDAVALLHAKNAIKKGHDRELHVVERIFIYLPFEHSERTEDQHRSVALFARLLAESPECHRGGLEMVYEYARKHQDAIERFGRYPHRNEVLGRKTTAAEIEFMRTTRF